MSNVKNICIYDTYAYVYMYSYIYIYIIHYEDVPAAGYRKQVGACRAQSDPAGEGRRATGNRQQATVNRQLATGNRQ